MEITSQTAAKNIVTDIPIVNINQTIGQVRHLLNKKSKTFDTINYIYIVNRFGQLKGVFSIKELFRLPDQTKVTQIMARDLVTCRSSSHQQKIVRLALKNNIKAIPVISKDKKFLGIVPSDQILEILNFEHNQDLLQLSGILPNRDFFQKSDKISILKSFFARLPWIFVGIFGGILAAKIVGLFENLLSKQVALATFIPLVVYISAAIGSQTQTIYIRDLAINQKIQILFYSLKQLFVASLIGFSCAILIFILVFFGWQSSQLAQIISLSVFIAVIMATTISLLIPSILRKLKLDPAVGSGPFATIIQDILSVLIYMSMALFFYR